MVEGSGQAMRLIRCTIEHARNSKFGAGTLWCEGHVFCGQNSWGALRLLSEVRADQGHLVNHRERRNLQRYPSALDI
jgi:hypothetical protein